MTERPGPVTASLRRHLAADRLVVDLGTTLRCLSSAVLGGGLGAVRTWVNLQVPSGYSRTDPAAHLGEATAGLDQPVLGMLTAAPVRHVQDVTVGSARAFATVGLGLPLAAAGSRVTPEGADRVGTINIFVVVDGALTDAALAGAFQTAVEAKVQALAAARVPAHNGPGFATGTATDVLAIACLPGAAVAFAGPATPTGADVAAAVYRAVLQGCPAAGR